MRDTRPGLGGAVRQWGAEDRLLPSKVLKSGRTDGFPNCYDSKQAEREFSRNKEGRDRVGGSEVCGLRGTEGGREMERAFGKWGWAAPCEAGAQTAGPAERLGTSSVTDEEEG